MNCGRKRKALYKRMDRQTADWMWGGRYRKLEVSSLVAGEEVVFSFLARIGKCDQLVFSATDAP